MVGGGEGEEPSPPLLCTPMLKHIIPGNRTGNFKFICVEPLEEEELKLRQDHHKPSDDDDGPSRLRDGEDHKSVHLSARQSSIQRNEILSRAFLILSCMCNIYVCMIVLTLIELFPHMHTS